MTDKFHYMKINSRISKILADKRQIRKTVHNSYHKGMASLVHKYNNIFIYTIYKLVIENWAKNRIIQGKIYSFYRQFIDSI